MGKQKTIPLRPKDAMIKLWLTRTKEYSSSRIINPLIRQAILQYLHTRTFICIGKIKYNAEIELPQKACIQLCYEDNGEIGVWMNTLRQNRLNSSEIIRQIIKNSITMVNSDEEEWYPNYLDLDAMTHEMPIVGTITAAPYIPPVKEDITPDNTKSKQETSNNTSQNKKKPMCASMFSDDDW